MNKLLEEFVSFARMSTPQVRVVVAGTFFDDITALYQQKIDTGRLNLVNHSSRDKFRLDPEAFQQVLVNLVKNGFESSDEATVTVTIHDEDDELEITVEDTGPGFTDQKLQSSFEPYVTSKEGGSGLGLVICHRIVHDHGGTMELFNRPEGGGGVRIRLPQ